jgi:PAS domain S-box-containing protein
MGLSVGTLRTYWDRLRRKLDARSRSELVAKIITAEPHATTSFDLLRKLPLFIWTLDAAGKFEFCSDWFCTYGGLSKTQALELGCRALMPEDELAESSERWRRAQQTGRGYEAMVHFRCGADGELRKHKVRLTSVRDSSGNVVRWIGYARELAENADERMIGFLKLLLETA